MDARTHRRERFGSLRPARAGRSVHPQCSFDHPSRWWKRRGAPQGDTGAKYLFVTVDGNDLIATIQGQAGNAALIEVDATSGTTIRSVSVPSVDGAVTGLGANNSAVWVGTASGWVLSLNPQSGALSNGQRLGTRVASLSASNAGVWVTVNLPVPSKAAYPGLDTLRLDPTIGIIESDTGLPIVLIATDGTSVWVLSSAAPYLSDAGLVGNIDPTTGQLNEQAELPVQSYNTPDPLGAYEGVAWVINDGTGTLIDGQRRDQRASQGLPDGPALHPPPR